MNTATTEQKDSMEKVKHLMEWVINCQNEKGFDQIVGQDITINTLKTALETICYFEDLVELNIRRAHSGVLLYGPSGVILNVS